MHIASNVIAVKLQTAKSASLIRKCSKLFSSIRKVLTLASIQGQGQDLAMIRNQGQGQDLQMVSSRILEVKARLWGQQESDWFHVQ